MVDYKFDKCFTHIFPKSDPKKGIEDSAAASVTDLGDASRDITGIADVSRSSIAKDIHTLGFCGITLLHFS